MASDRSPPPKSQHHHHVRPDSPSNHNTPPSQTAAGNRMPTSTHSSRRGSADSSTLPDAPNVIESHSRPMSAGASSLSDDATATEPPSTSATPAPYGTRSRGRNAAPRPNYAEDRDIDVDLEVQQGASKSSKRGGATPGNSVNGTKPDGDKTGSRKSLTATNGSNSPIAKDGIPGTSSFLAKPDEVSQPSGSSRKRKQPASSATPSSAAESAPKKVFTAAPGVTPGQGDSNMVSFEDRGAYLKNGKITADDGTTFAVN
ncbi:hypothetical protein BJY04DRAFT_222466, partial [Aspergillus karnatakaensis]|uniref:uncharacterized protein n=1 Tax=Aspergillus karnatakaensis TaxID=1810916 RepID=UPI003CCD34BD